MPQAPQDVWTLRLLRCADKHKRTLGVCLGGALLLGGFVQLLIPPTYESNALLYVQKDQGQPATHAALLTTTPVLSRALASASVRDLVSITRLGERAIDHLGQRLHTEFTPAGETVAVTYRSASREDSATVLHAVVEAYLEERRSPNSGLPTSLDDQGATQGPDDLLLASRLAELGSRQANADADVRLAANRLTQADAAGDDSLALAVLVDASGADSKHLGAAELAYLNTERKKLDQQLESMPEGWGPEHTIRGPIQLRADAMRYEFDTLSAEVATAMRAELERSHALAVQYAAELADAIAQTQTQAAAAQTAALPVTVFQWPEVPRHKAAPRAAQTLGIAALAGILLGLTLAIRREVQESLARDASGSAVNGAVHPAEYPLGSSPQAPRALLGVEAFEDLNAQQGMPLLGQMPEVSQSPGAGLMDPEADDPASSIHQIRAVLQIQATATDNRAFAFTSPHRGAGKTSVALGVASSMALSGTRTLVVDCDLAGRIQRSRAAETGSGAVPVAARLEDATTSGPATLDHDRADHQGQGTRDASPKGITGMIDGAPLAECIAETTTDGLSLLPAVNPQTSHISKLSDAFVRRVIDESRVDYDMVIFDTGPVPGSVEALLVASQCDGVVVVVKQGEDRKAVDRTLSYLKVVGARITGTVFNRVVTEGKAAGQPPAGQTPPAIVQQKNAVGPTVIRTDTPIETPSAASADVMPEIADEAPAPRKLRGRPLGSGIFAAAVFSNAESDDGVKDLELDPEDFDLDREEFEIDRSSDFGGDLADVFGAIDEDAQGDAPTS